MAERKYRHPQVNLRIPEELKEKIFQLAEANGRSANAEMVLAIEAWVAETKERLKPVQTIDELSHQVEILSQRLARVEENVSISAQDHIK